LQALARFVCQCSPEGFLIDKRRRAKPYLTPTLLDGSVGIRILSIQVTCFLDVVDDMDVGVLEADLHLSSD
jgi:hypothetical protein